MAVALEEPEKAWILEATRGFSLVAPEILHYIAEGLIRDFEGLIGRCPGVRIGISGEST